MYIESHARPSQMHSTAIATASIMIFERNSNYKRSLLLFSSKGFEQKRNGTVKMYEKKTTQKSPMDRHKNFVISHIHIEWIINHNLRNIMNWMRNAFVMISRRLDMTKASLSFHGLEKALFFFSFRVRFENYRRIPWWIISEPHVMVYM